MKIFVPELRVGNVTSVYRAFQYACSDLPLIVERFDCLNKLSDQDLLVLPGVGHFGSYIDELDRWGFRDFIPNFIQRGGKIFAICVGFQALFERSDEAPQKAGLGIFEGTVERLCLDRLPSIGWENVYLRSNNKLIGSYYFLHSFAVYDKIENKTINEKNHHFLLKGEEKKPIISGILTKNICAVQFHPEKSSNDGIKFIKINVEKLCNG